MTVLIGLVTMISSFSLFATDGFDEHGVSCKDVGQEWIWFSDHLVTSITYLVVPVKRVAVDVGTGVFHHRPYGSIKSINEGQAITAYGMGRSTFALMRLSQCGCALVKRT
ncbi:hypothetical protein ACSTLM_20110 [Vibrio parahaemolyticus]